MKKSRLRIIVWLFLPGLFLLISCGTDNSSQLKIGDPAPPFTARDLDGEPVALAAYRGQPVIIRFFLTDCPYCRADTPVFNEYFQKYRDRGLKIVYISNKGASESAVRAFAEELNILFPVILDADNKIGTSYHIKILPQTIILAPDHHILAAMLGGVSQEELQDILGPFL